MSVQVFEGTGTEPSVLDDLVWEWSGDEDESLVFSWTGRFRGVRVSLLDSGNLRFRGKAQWQWVYGERERGIKIIASGDRGGGKWFDTRKEAYQSLLEYLETL